MAAVMSMLIAPLGSAQPASKVYRIGYFVARAPDAPLDSAFVQGLNKLGYREGKNIMIERRFGYNKAEAMPILAAELAAMNLDVIAAATNQTIAAMKKATNTIPIVMVTAGEPVATGLILIFAVGLDRSKTDAL